MTKKKQSLTNLNNSNATLNNSQLNSDSTPPITEAAITAALSALQVQLTTHFTNELAKQTKSLKAVIDKQTADIDRLKATVTTQAISIESLESKNRRCFGIVQGIPETKEQESLLLKQLTDANIVLNDNHLPFRIGAKRQNNTRPLKIKFRSVKDKATAFVFFKNQRASQSGQNIFLNNDESPLTQRENYRLRKAKKEIIQKNPGKTVSLLKGILRVDDLEVDKFNLENQIFQ